MKEFFPLLHGAPIVIFGHGWFNVDDGVLSAAPEFLKDVCFM